MKLGLTTIYDLPTIVLQAGNQWYNLTSSLQVYQLIDQSEIAEPVRALRQLLDAGWMTPSFFTNVIDTLEKQNMLKEHKISEPSEFHLPFRPGKLVALGRNYAAHAAETGAEPPKEPIIFSKSPDACIGNGEPIVVRESYGRVDHEAELAFLIGKKARAVAPENARDYIAGYTILNDITARDMQAADIKRGHPWFRSKSLDTFGPLGPVIALPDEIPWPVEVDIELRVNGEVRQQSNTTHFLFSIGEMLRFITQSITLQPGDIVSTGTPEGISAISSGDVVEATIPAIGTLRNPVVSSDDKCP